MNNIKDLKNIKPNLIMDVVSCDIAKLQIDEISSTLIVKAKVSPDSAFSQIEIYDDNDDVEVAEIVKVGMYTIDVAGYNVIKLECGNDIKGVISLKGEGGESIIVDSFLSDTSTNPVQNKVVKQAIDLKADEVEVERIKYYGDPNIISSDENYFTVNETKETITGLSEAGKTQTELVIPYKINGKEITTLYSGVASGPPQPILYGNSVITKVVIPNSVTSIGNYAFMSCKSLTSINIPNSVTSIGNGAFDSCSSLTSIEIPNSVTSIRNGAFQGCTSLTSINIPNSVTSIEGSAFYGCANLTIYCEQGSYAETYAKSKNIPVMYTDISATDLNNYSKIIDTSVSISTADWISATDSNGDTYYTKTVAVTEVVSEGQATIDVSLPTDDIAAARLQKEAYQCIDQCIVNTGNIVLYCYESIPTVSFTMKIQILY